MTIIRPIAAVAAFFAAITVFATDIVCTPGTLDDRLGASATTITTLRLSGTIDATDFFFIDEHMPALRNLDLSQVTIAAYNGTPVRGNGRYAAATVPAGALAGAAITTLTLPASPVTLADMCFAATGITTLTIPAGTILGQGTFADSRSLASVSVFADATGDYTFTGCTALSNVNLTGTTAVGRNAFAGCTALASVSGADRLAGIGADAFAECGSLRLFAFGNDLRNIGDGAFSASGIENVDLAANTVLATVGAHAFAGCTALTTAAFGSSPTFGNGAFMGCRSLRSINMGSDVAIIPDYAFASSGISDGEGMLPAGVSAIGHHAYSGSQAEIICLPGGLQEIGSGAMEGMTNLSLIDATALDAVPALGNDVWAGVNQPAVQVNVKDGMGGDFLAADQWQNFHINDMSTAVPDISIASELRGRIVNDVLYIESSVADIENVALYGTDGMLLLSHTPSDTHRVAIALEAVVARIIVVRCTLADGITATLKLLR